MTVYYESVDIETRKVWALWRLLDDEITYQRLDRAQRIWVDDAAGIRATGIGGDADMDVVSRRAALRLLRRWGITPAAEVLDAAEVAGWKGGGDRMVEKMKKPAWVVAAAAGIRRCPYEGCEVWIVYRGGSHERLHKRDGDRLEAGEK